MHLHRLSCLAAAIGFAACALGAGAGSATAQTPAAAGSGILSFHGDAARSGHYVVPGLTWRAAESVHRDHGFDGRVKGTATLSRYTGGPPGRRTAC